MIISSFASYLLSSCINSVIQMAGSVPPLPPRRTISTSIARHPSRPVSKIGSNASSDAHLLQSVPPPPQHTKYRDLITIEDIDWNQNNRNNDQQNNNSFESQVSIRPQLSFENDFSLSMNSVVIVFAFRLIVLFYPKIILWNDSKA